MFSRTWVNNLPKSRLLNKVSMNKVKNVSIRLNTYCSSLPNAYHGVNPREYLSDIIARMPYMEKASHDKLVELLPHRWKLHQAQSMSNR